MTKNKEVKGLSELTKDNFKKAVIVFTKDSFKRDYNEVQRSYEITSNNKCFDANLISSSLYGDCLDGTDIGVRLDIYMYDVENKWAIERVYIIE